MKGQFAAVFCAVLWGVSSPLAGQAPDDGRPGVAVFRFEDGSPKVSDIDYTPFTVGLQQLFISQLLQNSELRLVDRNHLTEALDEINLGQTDRVDSRTALEAGRIVNARYVVQGTFLMFQNTATLTAITHDVETTEQIESVDVSGDADDVLALVIELARRVGETADLPSLPEFEEVLEDRSEREIPQEAVRRYSLALLEQDLGRVDQARALLLTLTEEHPGYQEASEALASLPES